MLLFVVAGTVAELHLGGAWTLSAAAPIVVGDSLVDMDMQLG
jgi:hypothetical protein